MFVQVNTFQAIKDYFLEELSSFYSQQEARILFEITCEHFLGWNKMKQKTKLEARLSESELLDFHFTLKRLKKKEPIQYILEEAPFMGLKLKVTSATLIPRPETEELVDRIVKNIDPTSTLLDIGTGSGCIPIAIKHYLPNTKVFASDISNEALTIAKENAKNYNLSIVFEEHDILGNSKLPSTFPASFDVIISNPPYVRNLERKQMETNVLEYEPHLALFVSNEDPMIFYREIASIAKNLLIPGGKIYFEINQYLEKETSELISELGFSNIVVYNDINNNPRILYAEN